MPRFLRTLLLTPALVCAVVSAQSPTVGNVSVNYATRTIQVLGANFGTGPGVTFDGYVITPSSATGTFLKVGVPSGLAPAIYILAITNTTSGKTTNYPVTWAPPMTLNWLGTWSSSTTYSANDAVLYNGGSYVSRLNNNTNIQPDLHPSAWTDLSQVPQPPMPPVRQVSQGGTATGPVKVLGVKYIIALQGIFPSPSSSGSYGDLILGEVRMFAGDFAPKGFAFCEGQLLPINQNQALFSLLGTMYGGDGVTTFALPDLRATAAVHANESAPSIRAD